MMAQGFELFMVLEDSKEPGNQRSHPALAGGAEIRRDMRSIVDAGKWGGVKVMRESSTRGSIVSAGRPYSFKVRSFVRIVLLTRTAVPVPASCMSTRKLSAVLRLLPTPPIAMTWCLEILRNRTYPA